MDFNISVIIDNIRLTPTEKFVLTSIKGVIFDEHKTNNKQVGHYLITAQKDGRMIMFKIENMWPGMRSIFKSHLDLFSFMFNPQISHNIEKNELFIVLQRRELKPVKMPILYGCEDIKPI